MGADDILSFVGLVRLAIHISRIWKLLISARFWRLVYASVTLSALPNSGLETMKFLSNPVRSRAGLLLGYCLDMGR